MGLFNTILEKLGLAGKEKEKPAAEKPASVSGSAGVAAREKPAMDKGERDNLAKPAPKAISEVDVVKKLEQLGKDSGLDWKVSIVDLLKLLKIDSSREARNELAKELGCPENLMSDSAKMNTWLHKEVLRKIAANGGNIPKELLD
ncbi:MAG: DUF3597 domain-containing protein [Chloroflexi bacterium]|nr:DUF3597 domain-containing protein [Chloroflexota bacterium]